MDIIKDFKNIFFLTLQSRAVSAWQNVQKYVCVLKEAIGNIKQESKNKQFQVVLTTHWKLYKSFYIIYNRKTVL